MGPMMSSPGGETECDLMDGPFVIRSSNRKGRIPLKAIEQRDGDNIAGSVSVDAETLEEQLLSAAGSVLKTAEARNWTSPEISDLRTTIGRT